MALDRRVPLLVVGGGTGGVAAALAAARLECRCLVVESTDWIGGQFTSQAVSAPDEHPWIESFGCTRSYRALRAAIRDHYRRAGMRWQALSAPLNPGAGTVSRLCHEPRAAVLAIEALLAPHRAAGRIEVWHGWRAEAADCGGDRIRSVALRARDGRTAVVETQAVIDATELGDLLPVAGVPHVTGAEASGDTGEPHAPESADPGDVQAFTVCLAVDHRPGEDHTVPRPAGYAGFAAAKHLDWTQPHPVTGAPRRYGLFPGDDGAFPLWTYRRLLARERFPAGALDSDVTLLNWPQNDCVEGNLLDADPASAAAALDAGRRLSLSLLHWLQTEAPRPDGGAGWPGLRLRPDVVGTEDGLAMAPYVRESRRILPLFRVCEQHVASAQRADGRGERFPDSVGVGCYRIDLHPGATGRGYLDIAACPFQIPLGALIPRSGPRNLLAGAKNIGTTHITNGCYRLHPVEWNVGEAAGALSAFCLARGWLPQSVWDRPERVAAFQKVLGDLGVETDWPAAAPR